MNKIIELNNDTFDNHINKTSTKMPFILKFWGDWCQPCKRMMPKVEAVAAKLEGKVKVAKVNVDESRNTAGKFAIRSIPTFALIKDGTVISVSAGSKSEQDLLLFAESHNRGV